MQITLEELALHDPDVLLPPESAFREDYEAAVRQGRETARDASVAFVAICRNAMPWLPRTLALVERTAALFRESTVFIYENDSKDGTKEVLAEWADGETRYVSLNGNGRPHLNHTIAPVRTHALAEYRSVCQRFVGEYIGQTPDYVIVFDTDPWGGWSVDGVANSIGQMDYDDTLYGLASYSWAATSQPLAIHYDAFAARLNCWQRRDQNWFHLWHPAVGSPPVEFRSAFGQLAVYRGYRYLQGRYGGDDCEHVTFHRSIEEAASDEDGDYYRGVSDTRLALNPSMRCVSFWVPDGG